MSFYNQFMERYNNQWTLTTEEDYNEHKEDVVNYNMEYDKENDKTIYYKKKTIE